MRKFWIFIGIVFGIAFAIALGCAIWGSFKSWFVGGVIHLFGEGGRIATGWANGIMANPFYLQYHPLIWIGLSGILFLVIAKAVWPKLPKKLPTPSGLASKITMQTEPPQQEQASTQITTKIEEPVAEQKEVVAQ